ncbi:translation initiation factor IF-2-like [Eptesicus fuscus]|uniref:translation initiation factor IF-2-like n=1 Tax=Eptesicus fuscus TaxID=29078 RepID=UPI0024047703|nr:translation initiation factor IF-2-like [Eptesicus fuscus]
MTRRGTREPLEPGAESPQPPRYGRLLPARRRPLPVGGARVRYSGPGLAGAGRMRGRKLKAVWRQFPLRTRDQPTLVESCRGESTQRCAGVILVDRPARFLSTFSSGEQPRSPPGPLLAPPSPFSQNLSSLEAEGIPGASCHLEPRGAADSSPGNSSGAGGASAHAPYLGQVFAAGSRAPVTPAGGLWRCQPGCASVSARPRPGGPTRSSGTTLPEGRLCTGGRLAGSRGGGSSANLRRSPSALAAPAPRDRRAEAPARVQSAVPAAGRGGGARPRLRPWPAPWRASCSPRARGRRCPAARLPGAGPGPEPLYPAPERPSARVPERGRRDAPSRLRARPAPRREQEAGRAGRSRERRAPHAAAAAAAAAALAGARLPARSEGPAPSVSSAGVPRGRPPAARLGVGGMEEERRARSRAPESPKLPSGRRSAPLPPPLCLPA